MWRERERGRDSTRTGKGAERNVLGLDRQEDMAILTAICVFSHRKTNRERTSKVERG